MSTAIRMATDSQLTFIRDLLAQVDGKSAIRRAIESGGELTRRDASTMIDQLMERRNSARATARRHVTQAGSSSLTVGMYSVGGVPVKVFRARNGQHLLAKKLHRGEWVYLGAARRFVTADQRMTLDQASEYGRRTGTCCSCGRRLTNPASINAGIGPICAEGF